MKPTVVNRMAMITSGTLKGFKGLVVAFDSTTDEALIKLEDDVTYVTVSSEAINQEGYSQLSIFDLEDGLEISRVFTMSTIHISEATLKSIEHGDLKDALVVYPKSEYGFFVYVGEENIDDDSILPEDLSSVVQFARQSECSIICIDRDGPEYDFFKIYDYK